MSYCTFWFARLNMRLGRPDLVPFALYKLPPTWIGNDSTKDPQEIVWRDECASGVYIYGRRDGFIIFEFDDVCEFSGGAVPSLDIQPGKRIPKEIQAAEQNRLDLAYRRFSYMNAFLLALYSAHSTVEKMGIPVQAPVEPSNYFGAVRGGKSWDIFSKPDSHLDYSIERERILLTTTLNEARDVLITCENRIIKNYLDVLSIIYIGCYQYQKHQFSSALVNAWTAVEFLINHIWEEYLLSIDDRRGGHTRMNSDRRGALTGKDYTASIVSQVLSIINVIDDKTLKKLNAVRDKRNKFVHKMAKIESRDAGEALRLATDLLSQITGKRITCQLSLHFWM